MNRNVLSKRLLLVFFSWWPHFTDLFVPSISLQNSIISQRRHLQYYFATGANQ